MYYSFLQSSALLAIQTAVIARKILYVCLSICPSDTFRCFVQTNEDKIVRFNEDTIVRFWESCRTIILVSTEVKFIRIFAGYGTHSRGVKMSHSHVAGPNLTNNRP